LRVPPKRSNSGRFAHVDGAALGRLAIKEKERRTKQLKIVENEDNKKEMCLKQTE